MNTLTASTGPVNSTPAADWPAWTDEATYELGPDDDAPADGEPTGPTADDDAWWSEQTRDVEPFDGEPTDAEWEALANEAIAQDLLERGLCC